MESGELRHFSHPQHILYHADREDPFKCDDCGEVDIGSRFNCALCKFELHAHCAAASAALHHAAASAALHNDLAMVLGNRNPIIAAGNDRHRSWKEMLKKFFKLTASAVHYVIALLFGDPTDIIGAIVSSLQS